MDKTKELENKIKELESSVKINTNRIKELEKKTDIIGNLEDKYYKENKIKIEYNKKLIHQLHTEVYKKQ
ncbi:MAG: hypothetical protein IJI84_01270 [Clostridia bacterium]|nr:hypothetical protein [Clostridia bacterium]